QLLALDVCLSDAFA
ncbi:DUF645 family protein, partial [Vibrio cholerae]